MTDIASGDIHTARSDLRTDRIDPVSHGTQRPATIPGGVDVIAR